MNLNQEVASLLHLDGPHLVRDKFNTRKLIIAAADNGKVHVAVTGRNQTLFLSIFDHFFDVCVFVTMS